jgi:hypothetical protein
MWDHPPPLKHNHTVVARHITGSFPSTWTFKYYAISLQEWPCLLPYTTPCFFALLAPLS